MAKAYLLIGLAVSLAGCAIRKNLNTPVTPPVIASGTTGGALTDPELKRAMPDYSRCANTATAECAALETKFCKPNSKGKYAGNQIHGTAGMNSDGSAWARGGGCVNRPIREVWAAFNNDTTLDIEAADSYSVDHPKIQLSPTITNFYQLTYYKNAPIVGTISWTLQWFQGVPVGTFEQPQVVEIIYQRSRGTIFMPVWDGKIFLAWLNDSTTAFYMYNHFRSVGQTKSDIIKDAESFGLEMIDKARRIPPNWVNLNTHQ